MMERWPRGAAAEAAPGLVPLYRWVRREGPRQINNYLSTSDRLEALPRNLQQQPGWRLDRVVGNLLDLSRVQSGAAQPERTLRALDGVVVQALSGLAGHERVNVDIPDDLPLVDVDAAQIERVLVNLLENALKFSPAESVVDVRVRSDGNEVVVRIEDEGPGIARVDREAIFEPFRRGPATVGQRGSGLGRRMKDWAIEQCRARGCRMVQLTTDKSRTDARRFYESLGFVASHEGMKRAL